MQTVSLAPEASATSLDQPEPGLPVPDLPDRAMSLRPLLRERQAAHEEHGAYSDELHATFDRMGFYRMVQARMFGGYEFSLPDYYRVMLGISRGDPGVGWCLTLASSHC